MNRAIRSIVMFATAAALAAAVSPVAADDKPGGLGPGDVAPAFSLPGSDGKTHALADHSGARAVVIAWFPKAFTGG